MLIFYATLIVLFGFSVDKELISYQAAKEENNIILNAVNRNSLVVLSGTTNINSFECFSERGISGGIIMTDSYPEDSSVYFSDTHLLIKVKSFDCKNPFITRDMYKALGGDRNSHIDIRLLDARSVSDNFLSSNGTFKTNALITINDQSNTVELMIDWYRSDEMEYHFEGSADIAMSDFDIESPSPAMGLIKVNDKITVKFNYIVQGNVHSLLD